MSYSGFFDNIYWVLKEKDMMLSQLCEIKDFFNVVAG